MAGLSDSEPVSRILSRADIYLAGAEALTGRRSAPATYLDLAEPGRRSCLALHRAGFAWPPCHHDAGALLPHLFTFACTRLTCGRAIGRMFLWHFPAAFAGWALPTALPFGVRTFLEAVVSPPRVRLARTEDFRGPRRPQRGSEKACRLPPGLVGNPAWPAPGAPGHFGGDPGRLRQLPKARRGWSAPRASPG